ncbi:MAG: serine hydrolase domain-containing protein [Minicystis sp.]
MTTLFGSRAFPALLSILAFTPACSEAAGAPALEPAPRAACAAVHAKLEAALDAAVIARGIPGAAAAVDVGGCSFRGASGHASPASGEPLGAGGLFRIGSITKTFVATLVLMLRAEGRVSLDDRVSDHVAGVPGGEAMTVRQLLNHTSGLFNYTESPAFWEASQESPPQAFTPAELIGYAAQRAPYFPPGKGFHYSNTNYIVAGLIVEKVGGEPLEKQLRQRILTRVGLDHTYLDGAEPALPGLVSGFSRSEAGYDDVTHAEAPSGAWAAGAMVSTTDDVNRFFAQLLGGDLLRPAELQEMTTWTKTPFPQAPEYGLGISEHPTPLGISYGHVGSIEGYHAWSARVAEGGATITVLVNLSEGGAMNIADSLAGAIR